MAGRCLRRLRSARSASTRTRSSCKSCGCARATTWRLLVPRCRRQSTAPARGADATKSTKTTTFRGLQGPARLPKSRAVSAPSRLQAASSGWRAGRGCGAAASARHLRQRAPRQAQRRACRSSPRHGHADRRCASARLAATQRGVDAPVRARALIWSPPRERPAREEAALFRPNRRRCCVRCVVRPGRLVAQPGVLWHAGACVLACSTRRCAA